MLFSICFLFVLLALVLIGENGYLSNRIKCFSFIGILGCVISLEDPNFGAFFIFNSIITFLVLKIKNKKTRLVIYISLCLILFNYSVIGHNLNNFFLTFYFSEIPFLAYPIYGIPFTFISLKYLLKTEKFNPRVKLNSLLTIITLLFFLNTAGYPFEKTFGKIQSLNFFQAVFLLISSASIVFIIKKELSLFKIDILFNQNRLPDFLLLLGSIILVNPSIAHIIIGILLLSSKYLESKYPIKIYSVLNFLLFGLLFLPDFETIKTTILGFLSWSSIFIYYNEFYILNSIGADFSFFIPTLMALLIWKKNQHNTFFNLLNKENNIKLPQFIITCLLILIIF